METCDFFSSPGNGNQPISPKTPIDLSDIVNRPIGPSARWKEQPGEVFQCFAAPLRCPGGTPGTCAFGRDVTSVACSACLEGLQPLPLSGECGECSSRDLERWWSQGLLFFIVFEFLFLILCKFADLAWKTCSPFSHCVEVVEISWLGGFFHIWGDYVLLAVLCSFAILSTAGLHVLLAITDQSSGNQRTGMIEFEPILGGKSNTWCYN